MKRFLMIAMAALAVLVLASCDFFGFGDSPELQVIVRANPGETPADMAPELEIDFGKPVAGEHVDVVFTVKNVGTADLILEADGPHFVEIVDQHHAEEPFMVLIGADTNTISAGQEVEVTIRFTGQSTSTRYTAKLLIPSNDKEHPNYFLNLVGDGEGFS
ncbi:MAG: hypothetical protein EA383_11485 [Spirochaetaceae bacterium]|nr:MAG: hypothetical protein EA383_11485 [Spirochaetaceae bacterium]